MLLRRIQSVIEALVLVGIVFVLAIWFVLSAANSGR